MLAETPMVEIEIYTGPGCGFCARAMELLTDQGLAFVEHDISDPAVREAFLARLPRVKSIPQIFIAGEHIGGYDDLEMLAEKGALKAGKWGQFRK